jgi:two-component system response regulator MprA
VIHAALRWFRTAEEGRAGKVFKRAGPACDRPTGSALRYRDLTLDPITYQVWRGATRIDLTRMEFRLLELFLRHPGQVLTRTQIFDRVWGFDYGPRSNTLNVYVGYLRHKTEVGGRSRLIHTVRGVGYVLRDDPHLH